MNDVEIIKAIECCASENINACDGCPFATQCKAGEDVFPHILDLIKRQQAEIEQLQSLLNGIILPPCRVGDVVYQVDAERIYPSVVKAVIYDTDGIAFDERAIGKTVFLTREEAEAKLREREL